VCGHKHICKVSNKQRSMTLECPSCKKNYAVIAADSLGRFRYVNEFLTGYYPPARFPKELSRLQVLFTIWGAVHDNCLYTQDPGSKQKQTDAWQTAVETQNMQKGDCEDSAIFLADWLLARGFQARVALGRYGDMGGHAWCVVRLEEKDYLLESTESQPDPENPPLAALIGSRYVPEVLFDRHCIYVRNLRSFDGNYWSEKTWTRLEPRRSDPVHLKTASKVIPFFPKMDGPQQAVLNGMSPDRIAVTKEPSPSYAPFVDIETIPSGSNYWQVPVPDTWER
jgi:predicted transglutaminase-like cysteine proteinase